MKKKFLINLIAVILLLTLVFAGCGEYKGIENPGNGNTPSTETPGEGENPGEGETPGEGENLSVFTVSLIYDDLKFTSTKGMQAQWTDGYNTVRAPFDGATAQTTGLDGDYKVTLIGLPTAYVYNPNIYTATNFEKDVTITVYKPKRYQSTSGASPYIDKGCIVLQTTGIYSVTLNSKDEIKYFEFDNRTESGSFTVDSWVDTTADEVNPIADIWTGQSSGAKYHTETINTGGAIGSYTKNFKYVFDDLGGANVYTFGIHADVKAGVSYPVTIYFCISQTADSYEIASIPTNLMYPQENFYPAPQPTDLDYETALSSGVLVDARDNGILDGTKYALFDDGYYHRKNADGSMGEMLFAKINASIDILNDADFCNIEYSGNKNLTTYYKINGEFFGDNYKLFIEGSHAINYAETDRPYYIDLLPQEEKDWWCGHSYYDFCNDNGLYPVTAELKNFLQKFSVSQRLFRDGGGQAEYFVQSADANQWLFACCYYKGYTGEAWVAEKNNAIL